MNNADLFSILDKVSDEESHLLDEWFLHRENFETPLRLAIQDVESEKVKNPKLNVSSEYHRGRLDGYTEAFEALFRGEEKMKEVLRKIFEGMEHGYD